MENQIFIYGKDTTTGLITPLNFSGSGQNVIINTSSSAGSFEIADATDFNNYIETKTIIVNDGNKTLAQGLTEAGASQSIVIKMSAGSFGDTSPVSIDKINIAVEGPVESPGGYLTEILAPLTLPASSQRVRLSGLQIDGGLTVNATGSSIVNHVINNCSMDGLVLSGVKSTGSAPFIRFMDCNINDINIASGWNVTTYFIRCSFTGTFTNANTTQGVIICVDCIGLPDNNGGTGAVISRASWAQSGTTQKVSAHLGYGSLGVIYSDYTSPLLNSTLKWKDEKTALSGGSDKTIALVENLATVATSGAYSDLSGTPTLATVATSGAYSDLSGTPTLATVATSGSYNDLNDKPVIADELDDLIDVNITAGTLTDSSYLGYNTTLSLWENKILPTIPSTLNDLSDVTISAPTNKNVLSYDGISWMNKWLYTSDINDMTITAPSANQAIIYNGTTNKWENRRPKTTDLSDTAFTGLLNGDVLTWSSALNLWYNKMPTVPDCVSVVFPSASGTVNATVGSVVDTQTWAQSGLSFSQVAFNTSSPYYNNFIVTGFTNGIYEFMATYSTNKQSTSQNLNMDVYLTRNDNNDIIAIATDSATATTAGSGGSATLSVILDFRTAFPTDMRFRFQDESTFAQYYRFRGCQFSVKRIY